MLGLFPGVDLLGGEPVCALKAMADEPLGPQGNDLPQVRVTASDRCQVEAYSSSQLQQELMARLQKQAHDTLGNAYELNGQIQMQTMIEPGQGTIFMPYKYAKCYTQSLVRVESRQISIIFGFASFRGSSVVDL